MSSILKCEQYIQGCLDLLMVRLKAHAAAGHIVDMANWTNAFAFDVVGELAYGQQLGQLETETDVNDLRKTIFNGFYLLSNLGHYPGQNRVVMHPFVTKVAKLFGHPPAFGTFQTWTAKKVEQRMGTLESNDREDLLAHFCRMKDRNGNPATFPEVLIEAMNIMHVILPLIHKCYNMLITSPKQRCRC